MAAAAMSADGGDAAAGGEEKDKLVEACNHCGIVQEQLKACSRCRSPLPARFLLTLCLYSPSLRSPRRDRIV